jgi:hypothetical protein
MQLTAVAAAGLHGHDGSPLLGVSFAAAATGVNTLY